MNPVKKLVPKRESRFQTVDDLKKQYDSLTSQILELERKIAAGTRTGSEILNDTKSDFGTHPKNQKRLMRKAVDGVIKENNSLKKEREKLLKQQSRLEEKIKLLEIKQRYKTESCDENGGSIMFKTYTDEDVAQAKLKIYESARAGVITESQKDALLEELDHAIDDYNERVSALTESTDDDLDRDAMRLFIYESAHNGLITEEEKDYFLENL